MIWKMLRIADPLGDLMLEHDKSSEKSCSKGAGLTLLNPKFPPNHLITESVVSWTILDMFHVIHTGKCYAAMLSVGSNQEMFDPPLEAYQGSTPGLKWSVLGA